MQEDTCFPFVKLVFDQFEGHTSYPLYQAVVIEALKKILSKSLCLKKNEGTEAYEDFKEQLQTLLPVMIHSNLDKIPTKLSVYLLSPLRTNASKFFFEMMTNWLVPGHRLNDVLFYAVDFSFQELGPEVYTLCEIILEINTSTEFEAIRRNYPILETEICLGVVSAYYARRILEVKGMSANEKTAVILEHLSYLTKRLPNQFDIDVFTEMQHALVMCSDEFKYARESSHLSRIISIHYYFRKILRESLRFAPQKRHLNLKLRKTQIKSSFGQKTVLAILVGMNFLGDKEFFEEKHLLKAIQNYLRNVQSVEGSFFANRRGMESICTLYLEIEKVDGSDFTGEEIQRLRKELPADLKDRIEHLMHPIFMPRNEEEIMRNILSLSDQIKYLKDPPHVFITFDEQTYSSLFFTVILVRVVRSDSLAVSEIFQNTDTFLEYLHDWENTVGYLRKKYPKDATVFRVKLSKDTFLRDNHSIDLYKARQVLVAELMRILGPLRDYNGGLISKQDELLCCIRSQLAELGTFQDFLLENFFYSLRPAVMRTILEPNVLKSLFIMMMEGLDVSLQELESYVIKFERELDVVYAMIIARDSEIKAEMDKALSVLNARSLELASVFVNAYDTPCLGYIFICDDPYNQEHFCQIIRHTIEMQKGNPLIRELVTTLPN